MSLLYILLFLTLPRQVLFVLLLVFSVVVGVSELVVVVERVLEGTGVVGVIGSTGSSFGSQRSTIGLGSFALAGLATEVLEGGERVVSDCSSGS